MTVDDALKAMAVLDGQQDGTEARALIVKALTKQLLQDPERFWDFYFETLNTANPSPYKRLAEELLKGGAVDETTTFGEAFALVDGEAA